MKLVKTSMLTGDAETVKLSSSTIRAIATFNGNMKPRQILAAFRAGHPVYTSFNRFDLVAS